MLDEKTDSSLVYEPILLDLVRCIMRAQLELVLEFKQGSDIADVSDQKLNKHFSWLIWETAEGRSRHFTDPTGNQLPLRVPGLRNRKAAPKEVGDRLTARLTPYDEDNLGLTQSVRNKFARNGPTRISSLIKTAFANGQYAARQAPNDRNGFYSVSPLSIALEFLTAPALPGTKAYSLFSIRNFLFRQFALIPDVNHVQYNRAVFTVSEVELSLSAIWTSLRPRYDSQGDDKLPPFGQRKVDGLIRAYLAMKGAFFLRFKSIAEFEKYLQPGEVLALRDSNSKKYSFEYSKSPFFEKLPETAELVNELFGLPIPLRGADTIFMGGLKFSSRRGLLIALHGGPGTGKTSLALGLCGAIAPLGIRTLFLTAEETERDLEDRAGGLVPDEIRRLSFFPKSLSESIRFHQFKIPPGGGREILEQLEQDIGLLTEKLETSDAKEDKGFSVVGEYSSPIPMPCRLVVVLDGLHDPFANIAKVDTRAESQNQIMPLLYSLIEKFKSLKALVVLTSAEGWDGDSRLDYLVDIAIRLSHDAIDEYGEKPDRRIRLAKARHQYCASGIHGVQIAGAKGVRFSPQIHYQLDQRSTCKVRLPNRDFIKPVMRKVTSFNSLVDLVDNGPPTSWNNYAFFDSDQSVDIYEGSHIFLNGIGSSGKAALSLKIAIAPSYPAQNASKQDKKRPIRREKILIVSFLYPNQYYEFILDELHKRHMAEYGKANVPRARLRVFHLYPGNLKPNNLYNKIEWELDSADLYGDPYTCVIIDGIHNVFLQFPSIEKYALFWPQLYSALRTRPVMAITTHTTLSVPSTSGGIRHVDDLRSEPLRHALVQKADFQFEVDPCLPNQLEEHTKIIDPNKLNGIFTVKTLSAINQRLPQGIVFWSRENMVLFDGLLKGRLL